MPIDADRLNEIAATLNRARHFATRPALFQRLYRDDTALLLAELQAAYDRIAELEATAAPVPHVAIDGKTDRTPQEIMAEYLARIKRNGEPVPYLPPEYPEQAHAPVADIPDARLQGAKP